MEHKEKQMENIEETNLRKAVVLLCTHESKYGTSVYASVHPDQESALAHVPEVEWKCDFKEGIAGEYFDYEIEEQVIDISKLEPVQKIEQEKATESLTMEDSLSKAAELVDEMLSQEGGSTLLHLANIYHMLTECDLEREERLQLTNRIHEIAGMSGVPVLSAERVDAVRFMLEHGISPNMSPEFTSISAEQAKELLLSCDIEVFADLVDAVAVDSQEYYGPEQEFFCEEMIQRVNEAIEGIAGRKLPSEYLDEAIEFFNNELHHNDLEDGETLGYRVPHKKYHIFGYKEDIKGCDHLNIEPNRVIDGACEPCGDVITVECGKMDEVKFAIKSCFELFDRLDGKKSLDEKLNAVKSKQVKENGKHMKKNEKEMGL